MRIFASGGTGLTACALFEPLSVFACPDVLIVPGILDKSLPAVHVLLPVSNLELDSRSVVGQMRAVLCLLVDDETNIELPVLLWHLHNRFVEVQSVDIELTRHLKEQRQIVDEIPAEVAQRSCS